MSLSNLGSFDIFAAHPSMSIHKVRIPCTCCSKKKGKGKEKEKAKGKGSSLLIQLHLRNPPRNPINSLYLYLISHNLCTLPQLLQEAVNVVSQLCHKAACTKWGSWSGGFHSKKEGEDRQQGYCVVTTGFWHHGLQVTRCSI